MYGQDSTSMRVVTDVVGRTAAKKELVLRSFLYVQAAMSPEDCVALPVDALVVDLSRVSSEPKLMKKMTWLRSLSTHSALRGRPMILRLPSASALRGWDRSLDELLTPNLFAVILPGCRTGADLQDYGRIIASAERRVGLAEGKVRFIGLVDTPGSLENLGRMRKACTRLWGVALGRSDYMARQGGRSAPDVGQISEEMLIEAASTHGLKALGAPPTELSDSLSLAESCKNLVRAGLNGVFVLSPSQVRIVNRAFAEPSAELSGRSPVVREVGGQSTRPKALSKGVQVISSEDNPAVSKQPQGGVVGRVSQGVHHGLQLEPGSTFEMSREVTLDSSLVTYWRGAFVQHEPLCESIVQAEKAGLDSTIVPQAMLVALSLALSEEAMTQTPRAHLGVQEVVYERPVYAGDTIRCRVRIEDVKLTKRGDHRVVRSKHVLVNQRDERVLSLVKLSALSPAQNDVGSEQLNNKDELFSSAPASVLTNHILGNKPSGYPGWQDLQAGQVILHRGCTAQTPAESRMVRRMLGSTPASDRMGLAGTLAEMARWMESRIELGPVWSENIEYSSAVTTFDDGQQLGMVSWILDVKPLGEHHEMVRIKSLGLRGLDAAEKLEGFLLPEELFVPQPLRPSDYERVCRQRAPLLAGRIVTQSVRRVIRTRSAG